MKIFVMTRFFFHLHREKIYVTAFSYDPFLVNTKEYQNQPKLIDSTKGPWKTPAFKLQRLPYKFNSLSIWSYIVPQKSDCYLTKTVKYNQKTLCAQPNIDEIEINCDLQAFTVGVNAIYSVIDYGKNPELDIFESEVSRFNHDWDNWQIEFNEDFYGLKLPLYHLVIFYTIMTTVEILVSISGLAYSYEEAPESMKAFVSSLWLLPVAIGNVLVVALNHLEAFQTSVLLYFKFNLIFVIGLFLLYVYVVLNYETSSEYQARKSEEMKKIEAAQRKLAQSNKAMAHV